MLKLLKALLQKVNPAKTAYQAQLEKFISEKNPSTTAEVEHWIREYDRKNGRYYA
jgi:hypothetical protein